MHQPGEEAERRGREGNACPGLELGVHTGLPLAPWWDRKWGLEADAPVNIHLSLSGAGWGWEVVQRV